MKLAPSASALLILLAAPALVFAQDEEAAETKTEEKPAEAEAAAAEAKAEAETVTPPQTAGVDEDRPFQIRRGFFAEADLGVFFTLGGYDNTKQPQATKRTFSNLQPYLGFVFGYDILQATDYSLSGGLKLAAGYSGGSALAKPEEVADPATYKLREKSGDFAVIEIGLMAAFAYHVSERVALTVKVDGGLAALDPSPVLPASAVGASDAAFSGMFGGGLGVEYFTLLNDFSVGLDLRFAMIFLSGTLENNAPVSYTIPAVSISVPLKYTF